MTPLRQYVSAALFGAGIALAAASAHADEGPDASVKGPSWLAPHSGPKLAHPVASGPSVGLGRSMGVLLLTSVLGGTALYLRSRKNKPAKARPAQLRVLGSTKLGGRANLVLAEVAGRKILLGVTDSSVRKLGWLEPDAEEEELLAPAATPTGGCGRGPRRAPHARDGRTRAGRAQALVPRLLGLGRGQHRWSCRRRLGRVDPGRRDSRHVHALGRLAAPKSGVPSPRASSVIR